MPKHKYIKTPEKMWEHFVAYKTETKNNPIIVKDWVGKDAMDVYREKERPLTDKGFYNYCRRNIGCVKQYFDNQDKLYDEYITICSHIKDEIDQDQIEGGMAGIYNPSITQRLNGLVDKTEQRTIQEQPLFPD
jgi:cellulase/cellobiase CelA1